MVNPEIGPREPEQETPLKKYSIEELRADGRNDARLLREKKIDIKEFARRNLENLSRLSEEDKEKLKKSLGNLEGEPRKKLPAAMDRFKDGLDATDDWAKKELKKL